MRCLIIHNPASGPRSDEIYDFVRALAQAGDEVVLRYLGPDLDAAEAAADARAFDRVVASGGDGTVAGILDALRDTGVPVLVFPSGTANIFANNIGNAPEAAALAAACRRGRTVRTDMAELYWADEAGAVHRRGFSIIAGTGFDADLMKDAEPVKGDIGEVAYFLSVLGNLEPRVAHFKIESAERTVEMDGIGCMVANTSVIQNGVNLFPACTMTDGLIDIAVIEPARTLELAPTLVRAILDPQGTTLGRPQLTIFQTREARITCTPSLNMEFDGEVITSNTGVFGARVLPGCLELIVDDMAELGR